MDVEQQTPLNRLNYSGSLESVVDRLCDFYGVGRAVRFSVIEVGYEDCNVVIETQKGKYVAKIFSKDRDHDAIARYSTIMEKVVGGGVNHPPLIKAENGPVVYSDAIASGISMVLMQFVDGKTFLELNRAPNAEERRAVIAQAALIHKINYHPPYIFDSWAIPNIRTLFEKVKHFIERGDLALVDRAIALFSEIPIDALPHCFVHGDFTKANVMKGDDGNIYILDFSVANWYPRIQELAVIAANLLHEENNASTLFQNAQAVIDEYDVISPLTPEEKKHLYAYALAGIAMEFLGAHQEKFIKGNTTQETEYWLNLGRNGLRKELANK